MAKCKKINPSRVLLGFEDEVITEKHKLSVGYWTNKIGGTPDWPVEGVPHPRCQLCGLPQLLAVQVYAPMENSPYHRTLYLFACINPNCWSQSQSWTCLRSQLVDTELEAGLQAMPDTTVVSPATDWCTAAGDWDDDDNGNFELSANSLKAPSDESDDSSSLSAGLGGLHVDECNANWGDWGDRGGATGTAPGAVGKQATAAASAEIEGDEGEVVSIDTPTAPQRDLLALLQETAPLPHRLRSGERNENSPPAFRAAFMSVWEEGGRSRASTPDHVRDLIQEYRARGAVGGQGQDAAPLGPLAPLEQYEKSAPAHGDKLFHHMVMRIQSNPGQLLRYCRDGEPPLVLYPVLGEPAPCPHCSGDATFELQLLPTLIPKLRLPEDEGHHLEFGTVLVYTCRQSCWAAGDTTRQERVVVQHEAT